MTSPEDLAKPLFDRRAWRLHRDRAARGTGARFLHREIAERLIDRLDLMGRVFPVIVDLGAGSGELTRALADRTGTTLAIAVEPSLALVAAAPSPRIVADPELVPLADASVDLAVSALALHWAADLPGTLIQLRRALRADGVLLAAMLGGGTLAELRTALFDAELMEEAGVSPRVSPMTELGDAAALLQRAGYAMPVADVETITVTYPDAFALMRDLRAMGESNALSRRRRGFTRRTTLARAAALYAERFARPDGRIPATFDILFLTARAPHPDHARPRSGPRRRIG
jgi:SAM-dependent methyltransferase